MNKELEDKIKQVIKECKIVASKHEPSQALHNNGYDPKTISDEYCNQINYTNIFLAKQKDLQFLSALLSEARVNLTSSTPSGSRQLVIINAYDDVINKLLKVYQTISIEQRWILDYYKDGGGLK